MLTNRTNKVIGPRMVKQVGWRISLHPNNSICATMIALLLSVCAAFAPRASLGQVPRSGAQNQTVRLRIAWGGGQPAPWRGELRLSGGQFENHRSLGIKSRAAAVIRSPQAIRVQSLQPIVYEAFDVTIRAPEDAQLTIALSRADANTAPTNVTLPIAKLAQIEHNQVLDEAGNRLLIQRSPGDELQVALDRDHLVFAPGETWVIGVRPTRTSIPSGSSARLTMQVISRATRKSYFREQQDLQPLENGELPSQDRIAIPIPDAEGVYELILAVDELRTKALFRDTAHIERTIQFVVVSNRPSELGATADWREVLEFDAAQPRWWESLTRLPAWNRLPLQTRNQVADGDARPWQHQGRLVNRLLPGQRQAYPLPLAKVGVPYILEVECAADTRQSLSISIVEPELESGQHVTGVAVEPNPVAGATRDAVRVVFWPQTRLPYVALENVDDTRAASFETIRLLAGPDHLPVADHQRGRLVTVERWLTSKRQPIQLCSQPAERARNRPAASSPTGGLSWKAASDSSSTCSLLVIPAPRWERWSMAARSFPRRRSIRRRDSIRAPTSIMGKTRFKKMRSSCCSGSSTASDCNWCPSSACRPPCRSLNNSRRREAIMAFD